MQQDSFSIGVTAEHAADIPFSFLYDGKPSADFLNTWQKESCSKSLDADRKQITTSWTCPETGLKVMCEVICYSDFPANDWVLYFENVGEANTPIISQLRTLDVTLKAPISKETPYLLHTTNGAPSNTTDWATSTVILDKDRNQGMGGRGGRSSNQELPFFKIKTGEGSLICGIGWSGQWMAFMDCRDDEHLHLTAGLQYCNFKLHPGERVRGPRILSMHWPGDTLESNAQFRQLIYKHYAAKRSGKAPLPVLFANINLTRDNAWLDVANADNQIPIIKALGALGVEATVTDAGWFEGGWPNGVGSWILRKDAYPNGIEPLASAASEAGMIYGFWIEPERVCDGTWLHKNHPEWLLHSEAHPKNYHLLNFGLREVQDYMHGIVKKFMDIPGFKFYRQDFNTDCLPYWLDNDKPGRLGITEMKYVEGMYAFWDRIAKSWPDSLREECASGGRRIDLETIKRMHLHQKSDYLFFDEIDQTAVWGLSQYMPNNCIDIHMKRIDHYCFHSVMASSIGVAWPADNPDFDNKLGRQLMERYKEVRHLLVGAWYPLLRSSTNLEDWMAQQFHRPDLDEGLIIIIRRELSEESCKTLKLHGLDPNATYELTWDLSGDKRQATGAELMSKFDVTLPKKKSSDLIVYRKV